MSETHHISRLQYRVTCPDEEGAFALRRQLASVTTAELAETMQAVCDRYGTGGRLIRIPRLEIHLETGSMQGLADELILRFGAALEAELSLHDAAAQPVDQLTRQVPELDALFRFLEQGYLPHWAASLSEDLDEVATKSIQRFSAAIRNFLQANAADNRIWHRIVAQFGLEFQDAIIALVPELDQARGAVNQSWEATAAAKKKHGASPNAQRVTEVVRQLVLHDAHLIVSGRRSPEALFRILLQRLEPDQTADDAVGAPGAGAAATTLRAPAHTGNVAETTAQNRIQSPETSRQENRSASNRETKLRTRTAGLVLLHPFLKPFFTELGLQSGAEWRDEPSRQRGIHLLHFLATGLQEQGEWNLVVEKIMCGLPPEHPVERNLPLRENEINECLDLLSAVIAHWSALKKTSARALQETFLARDGLLLQTAKSWQLQIGRKTPDVLLDALPWSLSLIKLPWNDYPIEVIWT